MFLTWIYIFGIPVLLITIVWLSILHKADIDPAFILVMFILTLIWPVALAVLLLVALYVVIRDWNKTLYMYMPLVPISMATIATDEILCNYECKVFNIFSSSVGFQAYDSHDIFRPGKCVLIKNIKEDDLIIIKLKGCKQLDKVPLEFIETTERAAGVNIYHNIPNDYLTVWDEA